MSRGFEFSMARLQQPCRFCGATPAPNGSIYTWEEALGLHFCEACSDWEACHAHPEYLAALDRDNASASGSIGAVDAWLNTVIGQGERMAWEMAMAKGNGKGKGKGKAGSRSRSPRRFQGLEQ
jgi:hypothetical protein